MKRIITISLIIIVVVGACSITLMMNKKKIDEKSKLDGNLSTIPVFVTTAGISKLSGSFEVNGTFSAIHELTLMSEGQGKVVELLFNTGDFVKAGQVLAQLDDELVRSQLRLAEAAHEKAKADLLKYEGLLKADAISSQQVEDAKLGLRKAETDVTTLRKQLDFMTISAPIQGTIVRRHIEKGSLLMPGAPVAEIVDVSRLKYIANVAETEAAQVKKGDRISITTSLFPGVKYLGTVVSVGVRADDARRFPIELEMMNDPSHPLRAGMFGTASFHSESVREGLVIPRNAIVGSIKTPKVYVVENGRAILKSVIIGSATDHDVEVIDGLTTGEQIVISGQINLDDQARVSIVNNASGARSDIADNK